MMLKLLNSNTLRVNVARNVNSRRCQSSGRITIDDVVFEKTTKSTRPEYVPRKFCRFLVFLNATKSTISSCFS